MPISTALPAAAEAAARRHAILMILGAAGLFSLADEGAAGLRVTAVYDKYRLVPFGECKGLGWRGRSDVQCRP